MPYIGLCGLFEVSFWLRAAMTAPLTLARVVTAVRSSMPRRKALSEWNARPSCRSMKLPAPIEEFGVMLPGRPSLLYPAVDRKSSWPPCWPTSTLEPAMLAPPARSKQINGILPAPGTMLQGLFLSAAMSGESAA